jgi:hypothetical protein
MKIRRRRELQEQSSNNGRSKRNSILVRFRWMQDGRKQNSGMFGTRNGEIIHAVVGTHRRGKKSRSENGVEFALQIERRRS